jgi:hypothetical protein
LSTGIDRFEGPNLDATVEVKVKNKWTNKSSEEHPNQKYGPDLAAPTRVALINHSHKKQLCGAVPTPKQNTLFSALAL